MRFLPSARSIVAYSSLFAFALISAHASPPEGDRLEVADYFRLHQVAELALSSDGESLAYLIRVPSLKENQATESIYTHSLASGAAPVLLDGLAGAHSIAWIPGARRLAFLMEREGRSQVFSCDEAGKAVKQLTDSPYPVVNFRFAPNGTGLAYSTKTSTASSSLYNRNRQDTSGILLNTDETSVKDFLDAGWSRFFPTAGILWIALEGPPATRISVPGDVSEFFWSSDSRSLSVTYAADDNPPSIKRRDETSIGIVDAAAGSFRSLAKYSPTAGNEPGRYFFGGEWISGEQKVLIRRITERDPWTSEYFPDWTVAAVDVPFSEREMLWHPAEASDRAKFFPIDDGTLLVEDVKRGVRSLFRWTESNSEVSEVVSGLDGSSSKLSFSSDFTSAAFVSESLTQPPEIYVRLKGKNSAVRLTNLNATIARKVNATAKEVSWASTDGTRARGWLVEPMEAGHNGPWPMVTMVHGGPSGALPNTFAPYFFAWPYPFDLYAAHGIAVFFPNYRGSETYGRSFASPRAIDGEPIDDIVTGVQYLITEGVADPERLGISGHSHGGWLGPLTMTRAKIFRASSFAEGWANELLNYELMPGLLNRQVHDVADGGSIYDVPQRYLDLSPDLHFDGVMTANLFESGAYSNAIEMFGYSKASRRRGLPTEMIVYPKTAHNLSIPTLQKESVERNLDWFRFWLKGEEDPDPAKAEQYKRWRQMKADWEKATRQGKS